MKQGWQSEATDGPKGAWGLLFFSFSFALFLWLSTYLPTDLSCILSIYRSIFLFFLFSCLCTYLSICLFVHLSIHPSIYLFYLSTYLSIYLSVYLSIYLSVYLSICLSVCLSVSLSLCLSLSVYLTMFLSLYLSTYLPIYYLSIYLSIDLSIYLPIYLSIYLSICKLESQAILRDVFIVQSWQHLARSKSARLPQCLNFRTSKSKQFCETSLKDRKLSAVLTASYQCVLHVFLSTCLKYCACHEKVMPGHTKCCTCHAKSSQQSWRSDAPKCNPSEEISALTS